MSDNPVTIRSQAVDDDVAVEALIAVVNPDMPNVGMDELRGMAAGLPEGSHHTIQVAEIDRDIVGFGLVLAMFWTQDAGMYLCDVLVHPDWRRQGVGGELYTRLLAGARSWGASNLYGNVREGDEAALDFVMHRGFRETGHAQRLSRLAVAEARLDGCEDLEQRLAGQGIRVTTLSGLGPDDEPMMREVYETLMNGGRDEPSVQPFEMSFEQWRDFTFKQPGISPETVWVAMAEERPVGVTSLQLRVGSGQHFGLAVLPEYRGRGVARLLKLYQIRWARERGIRYLYTGNDLKNPRMLDINARLGYEPIVSRVTLVHTLQDPGET